MSSSIIDRFLGEIADILKNENGSKLKEYLILEPPFTQLYAQIITELRQTFPVFNQGALEGKIKSFIPEYDESEDGGSRSTFISFMCKYLIFIRDVDVDSLLETHDMLKSLLTQGILALSSSVGLIVLPTVVAYSQTLARLAIGLDKRPELVAHLSQRQAAASGEETHERITLVESSANVIREAFKKCLSEKGGSQNNGLENAKPEGRRVGIYVTANLCLKLFFHCRKLRSAEQIFGNIYQQSPPLSQFPASQRVTYLYYLGRYLFANNHFFRAQLALQSAYNQCHTRCISQKRLILTYLISSNITLGRFPSPLLYSRPEATSLSSQFRPLTTAIAQGDLSTLRTHLSLTSPHAPWFLHYRILLQLANRTEPLLYRSLARRTFLLSGTQGNAKRAAPTLNLADMLTLALHLEHRALEPPQPPSTDPRRPSSRPPHTNALFTQPRTPPTTTTTTANGSYTAPDLHGGVDDSPSPHLPTLDVIESIVASLVEQDLLHGFLSHAQHRFAITGAKGGSALEVGFPPVWRVVVAKRRREGGEAWDEVPGWVRDRRKAVGVGVGPGMAVNLSGARAVGVGSE